jgi:phage-related minor tail protein
LEQLRDANKQLAMMGSSSGTVAKATKATQAAAKSTRRFGNVAQNTSYQVQDLIVQIQGGTDPMRALSQQLPQLTVGMGAWGAAIGLAAAALPALIVAMRDTEDAAADLDSSVSNIGQTFNELDLSNYVEQFLAADEATRELMRTTLEYQKTIASLDINQVASELPGIPEQSPSRRRRRGSAPDAYDDAAESLGLYKEQLQEVQGLYEAVRNDETRNAATIAQLRTAIEGFANSGEIRNQNLRETVEQLRKLEQAQRILETSEQTFTEELKKQTIALGEQNAALEEIVVTAQRVQNTFDANLGFDTGIFSAEEARIADQAIANWESFIETTEDAPEAFSLAAEAVSLFESSFERAITGVAQGTQDLSDAFKNMVTVILAELAKLAAYQFLANAFSGTAFGNAAASLLPSAKGNVFSGGDVVPFAKGGVVSRPTVFPMANGAGLMGEAGPEAILPLKRNAQGQLGVQSDGMNVIINNNAPGVAVNPTQTDQGLTIDVVMAQVSAAIDRGGNPVANSLERNYSLGRGRGVY